MTKSHHIHAAPPPVAGANAVDPVRAALQEMVDMMDSGDEHGAGSPWHQRATAALAGVLAAPGPRWREELWDCINEYAWAVDRGNDSDVQRAKREIEQHLAVDPVRDALRDLVAVLREYGTFPAKVLPALQAAQALAAGVTPIDGEQHG